MVRRIKWRSVHAHLNYEVAELAKAVGVCRSTVRNWIRDGLLPVIEDQRPQLIVGEDFKRWYQQRLNSRKRSCCPGEMFCMKCRRPRAPALGMVDYVFNSKAAGSLTALCSVCESPMFRACGLDRIGQTMPSIHVSICDRGADTKR
ncbi:helix-turn-helix domain-containing protein [Hyphococcus flavus]|uniref:Helix-turn-helix domain-containing protein n=1 Tax=Hyphococcus flavus TaxID=1866326 RepID=A0AAE9ZA11_9PROT|nr:helix-turn-helix domain-containing protein [Hyphococcus flavus]WDI30264.1 helix-turn-helix domain-containing protein [Hyphococcus flavus]